VNGSDRAISPEIPLDWDAARFCGCGRRSLSYGDDLGAPSEAFEGGWGHAGHANTNAELVDAARPQIAELQRAKGPGGLPAASRAIA